MKKILILCPIILLLSFSSFGATIDGDTLQPKSQRVLVDSVLKLQRELSLIGNKVKDIVKKIESPTEITIEEWLIIMLPAILFLLLFFYFMSWLKKENFKLSDALSADESVSKSISSETKQDPTDSLKPITTITEIPNYARSSSRVIAFLTGITAIVIAISIVTIYNYAQVSKHTDLIDLDGIWKIIAGLGIGVVPYVAKTIKGTTPPTP